MRTALRPLALSVLLAIGSIAMSAPDDSTKDKQTPKDKEALCQRLDDDFQELLKSEDNPAPLREAARLLAESNQNSHWRNYMDAAALLRKHRSKAAIPLLMKYMIEHASFGSGNVAAYVDTLNILAGEKMSYTPKNGADRQASMEEAVLKMYAEWWQPNKKALTTDLGRMSEERVKFVVGELLRYSGGEIASHYYNSSDRLVSTQALYEGLTESLRGRGPRGGWWKEELHSRMTPILLEQAGFANKPADDPTVGPPRIAFGAIPLLAVLRQEGQARQLDKIAGDQKQNNATRLACVLALHFAGEDMDVKTVLSILETDSRLECRVVSLLALGLSDKNAAVVPKLIAALDDNNREIRLAGMYSLRIFAPKAALPRVSKVVHDGEPSELVLPAIQLLGNIGGDDASAVLVEYMETAIKNGGKKNNNLFRALLAFSTATSTNWTGAGAHNDGYYAEQAQKAIDWWKARQK